MNMYLSVLRIHIINRFFSKAVLFVPRFSCNLKKNNSSNCLSLKENHHVLPLQEDIRDLINDSNISNISIIGRNQNGAASPAVSRSPKGGKRSGRTPKKAAASVLSPSGHAPKRGLKESLSQISLRTQRSLRSSMKRAAPPPAAEPPLEGGEPGKRVKVGRIEPPEGAAGQQGPAGLIENGDAQGEV